MDNPAHIGNSGNPVLRRFDEPLRQGIRYRNRPGAYAVIARGRRVLLTFQARPVPEFQLPGGGIDPGETPVVALHREVAEETGWGVRVIRRLGAFRRYTYMPEYDLWARKICHIYLCRPTLNRALHRGAALEEHHSAHWVDAELAAGLLANGGDRHFLEMLL